MTLSEAIKWVEGNARMLNVNDSVHGFKPLNAVLAAAKEWDRLNRPIE